uniref:DnaJ heat shock protein family (Hsp40) member A3b n=1 Tax=Astyanax mexicanus TaxID=7994 RepID=A0A3B1J7V9_ASTMX
VVCGGAHGSARCSAEDMPCSSAPFRPIKQGLYYGLTAKVGPGYIAERGGFSLIKRLCDFSSRSFYTSSVSSKKQDYYSVLGVSRTATQGEIKEAYKRLVKEYNPYTKPGDPQAKEKFAMVVEAFEVLSDEKTRKMYDDYGSAWLRLYAAQQQFGSGADTADEVELIRETFLDFAKDQDSEDFAPALDNVVELTFTEAVKGVYKDIAVDLFGSCPRCGGTGHHLGTEFSECPQCDGSGKEVSGPFLMTETCKKCDGSGIVMSSRCSLCKGTGQTRQQSTVSVAVPAGVKDGQSASISVGKKMIEVTFRVEESPMFRRDGDDVHSDMVISVADAILGGTTRAQGLYGTIDIPIPPGTQVDQKIRLAGKGFAHINSSSFGDHYVHIKIRVPRKISPLQRKLIESFAEEDRRWGSETWNGALSTHHSA